MSAGPAAKAKNLVRASERLREDVAEMHMAIFAAYQALRRGDARRARAFLEPFAILENPGDDHPGDDGYREAFIDEDDDE